MIRLFSIIILVMTIVSCSEEGNEIVRSKQEQLNLDISRIQGYISENK